jgi:hypothetical protein
LMRVEKNLVAAAKRMQGGDGSQARVSEQETQQELQVQWTGSPRMERWSILLGCVTLYAAARSRRLRRPKGRE